MLKPLRQDVVITPQEEQVFLKLLPILRREPPANGLPEIIIITRTRHCVTIADTLKRGKVDMRP